MNESLIKDIGRSYIISSLLPASFFVLLAVVVFRGFLPPFNEIASANQTIVISGSLLLLAFTMWVAFALYSSVDFIFKFFEGYYYPFFIAIPLKYVQYLVQTWRLRKYRKYEQDVDEVSKIKGKQKRMEKWGEIAESTDDIEAVLRAHEISAPLFNDWRIFLPTSLGNIILASELYPYEKYKLDGPMLFPRLSMVFSPEFQSAFEEKNNQVVFLLNSSLLSYVIGFVAVLLGWVGKINVLSLPPEVSEVIIRYINPGFKEISSSGYLWIGSLFILAGYCIYRASLNGVKEYALFVRTSFDLYRFKLLRELNRKIPTSFTEEKATWDAISEFMLAGERLGEQNFDYYLKPEFKSPAQRTSKKS